MPRKTFSMGSADEKRFYFECRRILPEKDAVAATRLKRKQAAAEASCSASSSKVQEAMERAAEAEPLWGA